MAVAIPADLFYFVNMRWQRTTETIKTTNTSFEIPPALIFIGGGFLLLSMGGAAAASAAAITATIITLALLAAAVLAGMIGVALGAAACYYAIAPEKRPALRRQPHRYPHALETTARPAIGSGGRQSITLRNEADTPQQIDRW